jgi:hypothetical protein
MIVPSSRPADDPISLWALQQELLSSAQELLGSRDSSKCICQPSFGDRVPRLINTPDGGGAFAQLSDSAAGAWKFAVFQLAHETVHLLNPTVGHTNYLEEGIAFAFSLHVQPTYGISVVGPAAGVYAEALQLVSSLPGGIFVAAKRIREVCGSLGSANVKSLVELFPACAEAVIEKLCSKCVP